jgi:uncharacterized membrane protein
MIHIASALAAAVLLVIVFMAAGILVVAGLVAMAAAGLVSWIAYRVARNALTRSARERRLGQESQTAASPPAA